MFTCNDVRDLASDRLDEALDAKPARVFDLHLERCADCRSFYLTFAQTVDEARRALIVEPPPDVVEALYQQLQARHTA